MAPVASRISGENSNEVRPEVLISVELPSSLVNINLDVIGGVTCGPADG